VIEIEIEDEAWTAALPDAGVVAERAATAALGSVEGDVVVLLTDDEGVRDLNARFRDRDRPTNVLSFPAAESAAPHLGDLVLLTDDEGVRDLNARFRDRDRPTNVLSFPAAESAAPHLGDLVLAYGVCAAEAEAQGKTLADHLSHLTVHGVLHLLGRDHEAEDEAETMEGEERSILASLGVADPYRGDDRSRGDA
jgi:probable rRNA maturation factor